MNAARQVPLFGLRPGTEFTLPPGGEVAGGTYVGPTGQYAPESDAKVLVGGKPQYWSAHTLVYAGRSGVSFQKAPPAEAGGDNAKETNMATKNANAAKSTKAAAPATKAEANGEHTHRKELSSGQVRALAFLAKLGRPAGRVEVANAAFNGHVGRCFNDIGSADPAKWEETAARKGCRPGLLQLGLCKAVVVDDDGKKVTQIAITAAGKKAAERAAKEGAAAVQGGKAKGGKAAKK